MEKQNNLDQYPIASLSEEQLSRLKHAEEAINQSGDDVYLIAFRKKE
ncbi:MAG: hypothetical protein ACM32O_20785 [Clostridia bacterium]